MKISKTQEGNKLSIAVDGRIDTVTAPQLQSAIDSCENFSELVLDFDRVEFISSAGLRVLLINQKKMINLGGMTIVNVSREVDSLFHLTGFSSLLAYELKPLEFSLDGCVLIGAGITGECWKVDDENILKLYYENVSDVTVKNEKTLAKVALIAGLPTAISFDVVSCGQRKGVLYELLKADTMSKYILKDADHFEERVKEFVKLCKTIHTTNGDPAAFPLAVRELSSRIDQCDLLSEAQKQLFKRRLESLPCEGTLIHGDLHTSNIMMQGEEPCLIDLGDMAIGAPVLDLGQIYHVYHCLPPDIVRRVVGMEPEIAEQLWQLFFHCYFDVISDEERNRVMDDIKFARCLKLISLYVANISSKERLKKAILEYIS